jgi:EAL domain-containing protein (putative c-di-GMP-specific phosphodiesterase class I)
MAYTLHSAEDQTWFQPIVDTFEHRVLGHECQPYGDMPSLEGLYFVDLSPKSIENLELHVHSTIEAILGSDPHPGQIIFECAEPDLAREPVRWRSIYDYFRSRGFGLALTGVGVSAGASSLRVVQDLRPEYIKLDERLIQNIQEPMCASMIGKLVELADQLGLRIIADGVTRQRVVEDLWLLGVQFMQGALFGMPAPLPLSSRSPDPGRYTRICHLRSTLPLHSSKA